MPPDAGRFVRQNIFLVAAVALPLVVVIFFLLAAGIPRWTVPPPAYDVILRGNTYDQPTQRVSVEFFVRDGKVQATVRPVAANMYPTRSTLFLFDHKTMKATQIAVQVPSLKEGDPDQTFLVPELAALQVSSGSVAPDGYELKHQSDSGSGLVGDIFGMSRYRRNAALVNRGRVISVDLPSPYETYSPIYILGWVTPDGR
jgi:hypothetical protein